jgi:Na+-driven multidrug efflux pump
MSLVNIALDYVLIFGKMGMPEMGIKGAGLSSCIADGVGVLFYIWYVKKVPQLYTFNIFKFPKPNIIQLISIIKLSLPMVFQYMVSLGAWFFFFVAIEQVGEHELAVSNVLRSLYMFIMTPIWGYAAATSTLVSNIIGQDKKEEVKTLIKRLIYISMISAAVITIADVIAPYTMLSIFTNDMQIVKDGILSLHVISASMLLFSVAAILLSSVAGSGDTRFAFLIEVSAISVYALYLAFTCIWNKYPLHIIWMAEFIYWIILGGLSLLRLRTGKWREIKI